MRAALYIRVSTDDQTEYSPEAQKTELLDYAMNHDIIVDKAYIYMDQGFSGKNVSKRPAFLSMIQEAKKKPRPFDLILVHKYDRFARNKEDSVLYKALLKKECGILVESIKEPVPKDDKFAVIYESMLEAMAEYYSLNLAEEVKKTMTRKAQLGQYQTAAPFGYRNKNKSLEIIEEEAEAVKYIFDQFVNYKKSAFQIAKDLNQIGILTHRGNLMDVRMVQYILNNPVYSGFVRWTPTGKIHRKFYHEDSIITKGDFLPIIAEETFLLAHKRIFDADKNVVKNKPTHVKHYLSGLIKCGDCGKSLVITRKKGTNGFFLQCSGYNHGQCLKSHYLDMEQILKCMNFVLEEVMPKERIAEYWAVVKNINQFDARKNLVETGIKKLDQKLLKARDAYLIGIDQLDEYEANKHRLTQEKKILEQQFNLSQTVNIANFEKFSKLETLNNLLLYNGLSDQLKKQALEEVVEKIIYYKDSNLLEVILKDF